MSNCHARQYSDEMHCILCRLRWDVNDPEPPMCGKLVPPTVPEKEPFVSGLPVDPLIFRY